jgi:uncharacterized Zn finger protein (UPF0148 family)
MNAHLDGYGAIAAAMSEQHEAQQCSRCGLWSFGVFDGMERCPKCAEVVRRDAAAPETATARQPEAENGTPEPAVSESAKPAPNVAQEEPAMPETATMTETTKRVEIEHTERVLQVPVPEPEFPPGTPLREEYVRRLFAVMDTGQMDDALLDRIEHCLDMIDHRQTLVQAARLLIEVCNKNRRWTEGLDAGDSDPMETLFEAIEEAERTIVKLRLETRAQ